MIGRLLDLIWPRTCEVCAGPVDRPDRAVCSDCMMRLPFVPVTGCCRQCGRDVPDLDAEFLCDDCRQNRPAYDRAGSVLRFDGDARELVNGFKFRNHHWLRNDFADWLEAMVRARFKVAEIDAIVPVPLTLRGRLDRGYNQCAYLASALAKRIEKTYMPHLLGRKGSPRRQSELTEEERRVNVVGTFSVRRPEKVVGKTLLVVDDIMTTGSTLSEVARVLKSAGCRRVWTASLARSLRSR